MENTKNSQVAIRKYEIADIAQMTKMSSVLKTHIVQNKLYTSIAGKNYVHVEGWQFAGGLLGTYPKVVKVTDLSNDKEVKWMAEVNILSMKDDRVLGVGYAVCSNKETKKKSFDEYAILSMAQTRAIGKAYRNLLGWVMKLAGYEGTPSEEMKKVGENGTPESHSEDPIQKTESKIQTFKCSQKGCVFPVTEAERAFSLRMYKSSMCRVHQKEAKTKK